MSSAIHTALHFNGLNLLSGGLIYVKYGTSPKKGTYTKAGASPHIRVKLQELMCLGSYNENHGKSGCQDDFF